MGRGINLRDEKLPEDKRVETNVSRFYESVAASDSAGVQQVKWYDEGVGTKWYDQIYRRHHIGVGLDLNIIQGYEFLAKHYEAGDDIYILGFSRGAYTARSLVGMVRNCGLVRNEMLAIRVPMAYGIYRTRDDGPDSETAKRFKSMYSMGYSHQVRGRLGHRWRTGNPRTRSLRV